MIVSLCQIYIRGSSFVQLGPFSSSRTISIPLDQFLAFVRFEYRSKFDKLGVEIGSFDTNIT